MTTRVALVDDHPLVLQGLRAGLEPATDFSVTGAFSTLAAARAALDGGEAGADVVVCDVRLPDGTGFQLLQETAARDDGPAFLMLSSFDSPQYVEASRRLGAAGFMTKTTPVTELVEAIRRIAMGGTVFHRVPGAAVALTGREREIVAAVLEGRSNDEIGSDLGIARKTVEAYLSRLYERCGVPSRTELALRAEREGWLDIPPEVRRAG